ncbi:MAG: PilZ domain-containing protein, partial [Deltaproteobacteria bacterium]|nr:PilZ domain-containing protein [Deltaproteobacteria bacterium]
MEYHEQTGSILLLYDGELANLAELVDSLGGIDRRGRPTELDCGRVWDVIIASAGRMLELHEHLSDASAVRIAVLDGDSKTLRKMLYRVDTDLLVRQPVHPAAFRLLILHALYRGPEKRRTTRVSIGAPIRFRIGLRRREAILAELSTRGCRMMADPNCHRAAPDRLVKIVLPPELTGDKRPLSLRGHVMRVTPTDEGEDLIAV